MLDYIITETNNYNCKPAYTLLLTFISNHVVCDISTHPCKTGCYCAMPSGNIPPA